MSHDTHDHSKENKTIISFKNSFWLVVIIVGLFIAALNFIQVESKSEGHGHAAGGHTEAPAGGHEAKEEHHGEEHHAAEPAPAEAAHSDTAAKAEH